MSINSNFMLPGLQLICMRYQKVGQTGNATPLARHKGRDWWPWWDTLVYEVESRMTCDIIFKKTLK